MPLPNPLDDLIDNLLDNEENVPEATDQQMQVFCDQRVRPFAESWGILIAQARQHKAAIDDVYARAAGSNAWVDARTDGPPHLMQAGNSANPDDVLAFNSLITGLLDLADNNAGDQTAKAAVYDAIQGQLAVLSRAVVRVIEG